MTSDKHIKAPTLFEGIAKHCKIDLSHSSPYSLAETGLLKYINLISDDQRIINNEIFNICNCIPKFSKSYVPAGDLINSYALYLDHLVPIDLEPSKKSQLVRLQKSKRNLDKKIRQFDKGRFFGILKGRGDINSKIEDLKKAEKILIDLLQRNENPSVKSKLPIPLYEAISQVSMLSGARRIDGKNSYNMEITHPNDTNFTYSPSFSLMDFESTFNSWKTRSTHAVNFHISKDVDNSLEKIKSEALELLNPENEKKLFKSSKSKTFNYDKAEVTFAGLDLVKIQHGKWLHPIFFHSDEFGHSSKSCSFLKTGNSLYQTPVALVLGYRMKFTAQLNEDEKAKFILHKNKLKGRIQLRSQGMHFNLNGPNTDSQLSLDYSSSSVIVDSQNNDLPIVLGVLSKKSTRLNP